MRVILTTLILLAVGVKCQFSPSDYEREEAPLYPIDLNLPPEQRWDSFPKHFCRLLKDFEGDFVNYYVEHLFKTVDKFDETYHYIHEYLQADANSELLRELQGLADKCGLTLRYLAMYNFMYEFGQLGCTAISFKHLQACLLVKNLDYNFHDLFSQVVFRAKYFFMGHEIFEAEQLFGFLGVITVTNKRVATTLNARSWRDRGDFKDFMDAIKSKTLRLTVWNLRRLFEQNTDFDTLIEELGGYPQQAPAYFTVVDLVKGTAAVITRGLNQPYQREDISNWYLVQTNSDRNISHDQRRVAAEQKLDQIGSDSAHLTEKIVDEIMSTSPNFLIEGTSDQGTEPMLRTISSSYIDPSDFELKIYRWRLKGEKISQDLRM